MKQKGLGNRLGLFQVILVASGILLAVGASLLSLSPVIGIGVTIAGLGIMVGGVSDVLTRWASLSDSGLESASPFYQYESYRGLMAVASGVFRVLLQGLIVVEGLAYTLGLEKQLLTYLKELPGIVLLGAGLLMTAYGLISVIETTESAPHRSPGRFLLSVPEYLVGIVLFVLGIAAITAGGLEVLAPRTFDRLLHQLTQILRQLQR
jgi:hypothetical protein